MVAIEEIRPGLALPSLQVTPTIQQMVLWAAAVDGFSEIHYDDEYAKAHGFPGIIVSGPLKLAFMSRAVTSWAGPRCFVRRISGSFRRIDLVKQPFTTQGEVVEVTRESNLLVVRIRLAGISADGTLSTPGAMTIDLPIPGGA